MLERLSNFYKDNAYNESDFEIFMRSEDELISSMTDYQDQIFRNKILGMVETYRIFDCMTIPCGEACYDLRSVLSNDEVANVISGGSVDAREATWNAYRANDSHKFQVLDITGNYIDFSSSYTVYPFQGKPAPLSFSVVSMDLYMDGEKMQLGTDYDLSANRLYFLSERLRSLANKKKAFIAYDVAVDYNTVTRYFGDNLDLPEYDDISKFYYNEILQTLVSVCLKGPTAHSIKEGVKAIAEESNVYDVFTAPSGKTGHWTSAAFGDPFYFIVELPEDITTSSTVTDMMTKFLDKIKPAYTKYDIISVGVYSESHNVALKTSGSYNDIIYLDVDSESYDQMPLKPVTTKSEAETYPIAEPAYIIINEDSGGEPYEGYSDVTTQDAYNPRKYDEYSDEY